MRALDAGRNSEEKGRAFEDLVRYMFERVPGMSLKARDQGNFARSEEIDLAFWNDRGFKGFPFLGWTILIECKNWSSAVGSAEVSVFASKLRVRGLRHGILVARNGISGSDVELRNARQAIADALTDGRSIIVLKLEELQSARNTDSLRGLVKQKLCELAVMRAPVP